MMSGKEFICKRVCIDGCLFNQHYECNMEDMLAVSDCLGAAVMANKPTV